MEGADPSSSCACYKTVLGEALEAELAAQPLHVNQLVWVCKSKGLKHSSTKKLSASSDPKQRLEPFLRARILSLNDDPTTNTNNKEDDGDRVQVIYPKGSTYHVRKTHLWRILSAQATLQRVVVWPETDVYRKCCVQHTVPDDDDVFVEIGCDYGTTVHKVAATAATTAPQVLGIDKSAESIAIARQRYPQLPFLQWDILQEDVPPVVADGGNDDELPVWKFLYQRQQQQQPPPESPFSSLVVAMDINGNRELEAVQACLAKIQSLWRPRLIVVKSRALHAHIAALSVAG